MATSELIHELSNPSNPLTNDNVLKLAVFATNGTGGSLTLHDDRFEPTWDANVRVAKLADEIGFEAIISFARWLPYSGIDGSPSGRTLDPIAWAAGLATVTKRICVMSTIHTFLHHPLVIAKMGATIDRISNGRWGLNLVCGWFKPEFDMFGQAIQTHENRFDAADEWVEIIERAWADPNSFDYDGAHYQLKGAYSDPKPIQSRPIIMNAGGSGRGQEFSAHHSEMAFILPSDHSPEAIKVQTEEYRALAREKFGREIKVWMLTYCIHRDSREEAEAYLHEYAVEHGDYASADQFVATNLAKAKTLPPEIMARMSFALRAGAGGYPLLGSAEEIADSLKMLSDAGVDGVLMTWIHYEDGLHRFAEEVLPLLEKEGLRQAR